MTQRYREQRIHYRMDETTQVNQDELKVYNVPFAGNTNVCRETFIKGNRVLEYSIAGDLTLEQMLEKPVFRDELIEYLYSISRQMVSMVHNGLKLERIVFDFKLLYIRLSDFSVQLLYLPFDNTGPMQSVEGFLRELLARLVFAHTSAVECANQITEYLDEHRQFDVVAFSMFIKELRATSQLLIKDREIPTEAREKAASHAKTETGLLLAEEAVRKAEMARMQAENEVKRLMEYAKKQEEAARAAEETRMLAEAARIQAEISKQSAEKEYKLQSKTAILYSCQMKEQTETAAQKEMYTAKLTAEDAAKRAETEFRKASVEAERLAEKVRLAREEEMRAEEARMRAEYDARKNKETAKRLEGEVRRRNEEIRHLSEDRQASCMEEGSTEETTVITRQPGGNRQPVLIRKRSGERIYINKQVFCIGKADQGVDFKITDNKSVSRRHAYITNINGVYYLRDNNSTNHSYLNGEKLYSNVEVMIPDNSTIQISNEEFFFRIK